MINKQANILFMPSSVCENLTERRDAFSHDYYQQLIYTSLANAIYANEGFQSLGRQLAALARRAYLARRMDVVMAASRIMLDLPLSNSLRSLARYYQAIQLREHSPRNALEKLVEEPSLPLAYKARVLLTLGGTYIVQGDPNNASILAKESLRVAADPNVCDLLSVAEGARQIALVRSIHGDHKRALADLEKAFPLVCGMARHYPALYYDFLNSLAVELGAVGRVTEAAAALAIPLASPFAAAYPEWRETRDEIEAKCPANHSKVSINRAIEADLYPQVEPPPLKAGSFDHEAGNRDSFQRSIYSIPATATTSLNAVSTLDRVLICIGPRAPPPLLSQSR